jgi:hypothetical protein
MDAKHIERAEGGRASTQLVPNQRLVGFPRRATRFGTVAGVWR